MVKNVTISKAELAYIKGQASKSPYKGTHSGRAGEKYYESIKKVAPKYKEAYAREARRAVSAELSKKYVADIRAEQLGAEKEAYYSGSDVSQFKPVQALAGFARRYQDIQGSSQQRELQKLRSQSELLKARSEVSQRQNVAQFQQQYGQSLQSRGAFGSVPQIGGGYNALGGQPQTPYSQYQPPRDPLSLPNSGLGMPNLIGGGGMGMSLGFGQRTQPQEYNQPVPVNPQYTQQPQQVQYQQQAQPQQYPQPPTRPYVRTGSYSQSSGKKSKAFYVRVKNPATGAYVFARARFSSGGQIQPENEQYNQQQ